jgi:hypothetical protein
MRIEVRTVGNRVYYLNFDLIVEFNFEPTEDGNITFTYSGSTEGGCFDIMKISLEQKNRILNKLDLL